MEILLLAAAKMEAVAAAFLDAYSAKELRIAVVAKMAFAAAAAKMAAAVLERMAADRQPPASAWAVPDLRMMTAANPVPFGEGLAPHHLGWLAQGPE